MTLLQSAEDIGAEIATRLATCTVALGAETDLGAAVMRGRRTIDDSMIPCCVIIEADDSPETERVGTRVAIEQRYLLFAYVPCDPLNPNDAAHAAIRDMERAMFRTNGVADARLGGKVHRVQYLGRDIGPRADGAAFVLAAVEVSVKFAEDLANP